MPPSGAAGPGGPAAAASSLVMESVRYLQWTPTPCLPGARRRTPGGPPDGPFPAFLVTAVDGRVDAGVGRLSLDDLPPGEVLVAVEWSAVNYKDGMVSRPGNRVARISPLVPGVDLVGHRGRLRRPAVAVGTPVIAHGYDLGRGPPRRLRPLRPGPAGWVVPLPDGLTPRRAAVLGTAGFTAALSLHRLEHHGLRPGTGPVLVTGASGGVGGMAVALAAARGYEVVASTGRTAERDYLLGLGAAEVIGRDDLVVDPGAHARTRAVGRRRRLRGRRHPGRRGADPALRRRRGRQRTDRRPDFETTVYPFIVRNAALLGVDTVADPDRRAPVGVGRDWRRGFPAASLDALVDGEVGLDGAGAGARGDPGRPGAGPDAGAPGR